MQTKSGDKTESKIDVPLSVHTYAFQVHMSSSYIFQEPGGRDGGRDQEALCTGPTQAGEGPGAMYNVFITYLSGEGTPETVCASGLKISALALLKEESI